MERVDRLAGFIFLILAIGICWESSRISLGTLLHPGPGFISFIAGMTMAILSSILIKKGIRRKGKETLWKPGADKRGLVFLFLLMVLYGAVIDFLGFLTTSILFFLAMGRFVARLNWKATLVLAILSSLSAYLIFQVWLKTQLPKGLLV